MSFRAPTTAHVLAPASYCSTSGTALGHWPQPARMMVLAREPEVNPNAWDSSHASVRGAVGTQEPVPFTELSDVVWANRTPPMFWSPPIAYTLPPSTAAVM